MREPNAKLTVIPHLILGVLVCLIGCAEQGEDEDTLASGAGPSANPRPDDNPDADVSVSSKPDASGGIELIRTPNGGVQPRAVGDESGGLHLLYLKKEAAVGNLYYVTRGSNEKEWSTPIRVNSLEGGAVPSSAIDCAQLALGKNGRIHVTWFNMNPPSFWYARLTDDGSAFEPERNLVTQNGAGVEAGASIAADVRGNVFLVWHAGDLAREDRRAVYMTHSSDGGKTFGPEKRVNPDDTGVCACCGISAFVDEMGTLLISYRSARRNIHRDMMLLASEDRGRTFSSQMIHPWQLNSCPVTTTTIAEGPHAGPLVAWQTRGQLFFADIDTLAEAVAAPGFQTASRQKNQTIAINAEGETLLAWAEGKGWGLGGELHWQRFDASGKAREAEGPAQQNIPASSLPTSVARPDGSFVLIY